MIVMTYEQWLKKGEKLFGPNPEDWQFKCVNCGHIQTMSDFKNTDCKDPKILVFQECIGNYRTGNGNGCDWTTYGHIQKHNCVVTRYGKSVPVFEFAS